MPEPVPLPAPKKRGPKTPDCKARSARNALKHGLRARQYVPWRYWLTVVLASPAGTRLTAAPRAAAAPAAGAGDHPSCMRIECRWKHDIH